MFSRLKQLYFLLTREQRRRFRRLQLLVLLMSFAEIAGVLSIGPFMALVSNIDEIGGQGLLSEIYRRSGISNPENFLVWVGIASLLTLSTATALSMFTIWRLAHYGVQVGAELSGRLFRHYLYQPWLYHAKRSSSQLTNQISLECGRITHNIIHPLMLMNAQLAVALVMSVALFIYNPLVVIIGLLVFSTAYIVLYHLVRKRLSVNGTVISETQSKRFRLMSEGFGGIKEILLTNRQEPLLENFDLAGKKWARSMSSTNSLTQIPRYVMELVAFAAVVFLVIYLLSAHDKDFGEALPILSIYALAGFKMLPAFQRVYASVSEIRGNLAAFDSLRDDLQSSALTLRSQSIARGATVSGSPGKWVARNFIQFKDVSFTYPGKVTPALNHVHLTIPVNSTIGFVGASGSGKSTAIDLLLGLIEPDGGEFSVDGTPVTPDKMRSWQNNLGFVPQTIFLSDTSIRENIAFGLPPSAIDDARVKRAVVTAQLDEWVATLPDGLETRVGERGAQLSGGQRQRIGIARALYDDAEMLVLDEATSSLDGITEKMVMDAIHSFSGNKTIVIIAHRLSTVKECDSIYVFESGSVIDTGRYQDLVERNPLFQNMVEHS